VTVYLTLDSEALSGRAFRARDLLPLLGQTTRGSNAVLPGATGRRALAPVIDEIDVAIEWVVNGLYDEDDLPHSTPAEGLAANLDYFRALFMESGDTTTGLIDASVTLPGVVLNSSIQCLSWDPQWNRTRYTASVLTRLVVPSGLWTPTP
jgi:hypothetical protein